MNPTTVACIAAALLAIAAVYLRNAHHQTAHRGEYGRTHHAAGWSSRRRRWPIASQIGIGDAQPKITFGVDALGFKEGIAQAVRAAETALASAAADAGDATTDARSSNHPWNSPHADAS